MRLSTLRNRTVLALLALLARPAVAQEKPEAPEARVAASAPAPVPAGAPLEVSLAQALELARQNGTAYQAAVSEAGTAREASAQARDGLLPQVAYSNQ